MYLQFADWAVPLIFLLALVLLLKFRPALIAVSRESYVSISSGVATLAIVSIARVYYLNGLFMPVPFLSEPLFYRVVSWIGIITGTVLVVNGMSSWLPIAKIWREATRTETRYSGFVRKIERLTQVESRADRLISLALTVMAEHFDLNRGIALRYSRRSNRFHLTGCFPDTCCVPESFAHTTVNYQSWRQLLANGSTAVENPFEGLPASAQHADLLVPLSCGEQPLGCYLLWPASGAALSDEDTKYLRLAAEIIGRRIDTDRLRMRADYYHRLAELHERVQESISPARPLLKNLGAVLTAVNQTLNVEFVSLQIFASGPHPVTCLSLGHNGALLIEKGLALPPEGSPIHRALISGQPTLHREPEQSQSDANDARLAMPLLAAVPVPTESEMSFIFVISSHMKDRVGMQTARMLQSLGPIVTRLAEMTQSATADDSLEQTLSGLCDIHHTARQNSDIHSVCTKAADFLKHAVRADCVRISEVETHGPFLRSLAVIDRDILIDASAQDKLMTLTLMPLHEEVIKTGMLKIWPSESVTKKLTTEEMKQCFGANVNSLVIAPIVRDGKSIGLLSIGRISGTAESTFTQIDILKIRAVADSLAAAFHSGVHELTDSRDQYALDPHGGIISDLEFRSRMKSSLSGIMGSIELMKAQGEPSTQSVNRYLSIIDKSAQRMHQYLEPEEHVGANT